MHDDNPYQAGYSADAHSAALADEWERTTFIRRTYGHLLAAVGLFVVVECLVFSLLTEVQVGQLTRFMTGGRFNWLMVLGGFMLVSWIASSLARSVSQPLQYVGLGAYIIAYSVLFIPLLYIAQTYARGAIPAAGIMTGIVFVGLTAIVFTTRADFSWLGKFLALATFAALGLIVCGVVFQGFPLGIWFSGGMVVICAGYILYDTSNVLHHYRTDQHVAASIALFASVATLFWYILQIVIALSGRE